MPTPSPKHLLHLISRSERLESLPRTGWLVSGVQHPESIAAHSYMVTLIALWIADAITEQVDTQALLRMALTHDLGESMLTDLPWPVKQFVGAGVLKDAEARATDEILEHAPDVWRQHARRYDARACLESRIIKAADKIQMLAKSLQYRQQQRGDISRFWENGHQGDDYGIPLVADIFAALQQHYDHGTWYPSDFG